MVFVYWLIIIVALIFGWFASSPMLGLILGMILWFIASLIFKLVKRSRQKSALWNIR